MTDALDRLQANLGDRYQLDRELGAGGMATVYLANDRRHGRRVAVKVFRPELARAIGPDRFTREIQLAAQLQHPHILSLIDSGEADGLLYYLMPFVDGESLRERLTRTGALPLAEAIRLAIEVAEALDYAHRRGVVHRDIKPENILLSDGGAVVADFGIALALANAGDDRLTQTGFSLGTPAYMSPEQITGIKAVDGRADQYSLGCVLFEMLAGEPPFGGPTANAVMVKHATEAAPALRGRLEPVPDGAAKAVRRALAKNPEERFSSCAAFGAALGVRWAGPVVTEAHPTPQATLVVLPFLNRSASADDEYFSDGLTDELISDLSKVKAMRVISRTSASKLKGTLKDLPTIGRELNVRYVLAGTVRRAAEALRITAELVDTSTDTPVWSEKYSGTMADVFDLQERISRQIVAALAVTLTPEESRKLAVRPVTNVQAYECYLRARHLVLQFSAAALDLARAQVERALELTGDNALLLATLAYIQSQYVNIGASSLNTLESVERSAKRAIELDPNLPLSYVSMAFVQEFTTGLIGSLPWYRQAVARGEDIDAMAWASISYAFVGDIEAARQLADRATLCDPLNWAGLAGCWTVEFNRGQFDAALEHARHALRLEPNNSAVHLLVGLCLMYQGGDDDALLEFDAVGRSDDAPSMARLARINAAAIRGDRDAVLREVSSDLADLNRNNAQFAGMVAAAFARLNIREEALDWMSASIERGLVNVQWWTQHDRFFAPYRQDPEFLTLIARAHELRRAAGLE